MTFVEKFLKKIELDDSLTFEEKLDYEAAYRQTFWDATITFKDKNTSFNKRYIIENGKVEKLDEDKRGDFFVRFVKDLHLATIQWTFADIIKNIEQSEAEAFSKEGVLAMLKNIENKVVTLFQEVYKI